jgi:hypothetical protein
MRLESRLQTVRGTVPRCMQAVDFQPFDGPCVQQQSRVNAVLQTCEEPRRLNPALREKTTAEQRPLKLTQQMNESEAHPTIHLPPHLRLSASICGSNCRF